MKLLLKKPVLLLAVLSLTALIFASCSGAEDPTATSASQTSTTGENAIKQYNAPPAMSIDSEKSYTATLKTNHGDITIELYAADAPITVNSFVFLARDNFYDGVIFHRVIEGFMIQGGDPTGTGTGGPGYRFQDEIVSSLTFAEPGLLAMANAGPGTNGSQFFITVAPTPHLNGNHTIFGKVTEGYDVVLAISQVDTGPRDKPVNDVVIESVDITEG